MDRLLFVSADGHTTAPPETFRPYLEKRYQPLIDELVEENDRFLALAGVVSKFPPEVLDIIDCDDAIRSGGQLGAWDVDRRLAEMDREGVAAELLIYGTQDATTPFFGLGNRPRDPEIRSAGARAYHRWLADCMAKADGRLFAIADPGPSLNMDETIKEMRWVAEHGFRSISVPGIVADDALPPLYDSYYEPFWRACVELNLVLSVHAGHGKAQGEFLAFMEHITKGATTQQEVLAAVVAGIKDSPFELDLIPRQIMWNLMLGGVFDRYPGIKLALTEVRADWVPQTLRFLDNRYEQGGTPLQKRPSEYWAQNCWVGASSIKLSEVRLRNEIGIERMMFGRDYPHPESTWPNTWDWLRDSLGGVASEHELRLLLGETAVDCYGLDRAKLTAVAQEIGPLPSDILGSHEVDARIVEHFDQRGGYKKSTENVDTDSLSELFEHDLAALASA